MDGGGAARGVTVWPVQWPVASARIRHASELGGPERGGRAGAGGSWYDISLSFNKI